MLIRFLLTGGGCGAGSRHVARVCDDQLPGSRPPAPGSRGPGCSAPRAPDPDSWLPAPSPRLPAAQLPAMQAMQAKQAKQAMQAMQAMQAKQAKQAQQARQAQQASDSCGSLRVLLKPLGALWPALEWLLADPHSTCCTTTAQNPGRSCGAIFRNEISPTLFATYQ